MNDAVSRDRLQPALLDRLVDNDPRSRSESLESRAITRQRLRQSVLRDLGWLLNAQAGFGVKLDRKAFSRVLESTLNFGMPALSGLLVSDIETAELECVIRKAIATFEPRILPETLTVRAAPGADALSHHNVLEFEISGQLWAQPYPLELLLKTSLDLETGLVEVRERDGAPAGVDPAPMTPSSASRGSREATG